MPETTTLDDNDLEETSESTTVTGSMKRSNANIDTTPANESPSSSQNHPGSTPSTTMEQDLTFQHVDNGMTSPDGSIVDCDSKDTKNVEQLAKDCYGKRAQNYGGPRRELFATIIKEIYAKYFEKGWREQLANDYEVVGLIFSLSIIQNGLLPRFFEGDMHKVTFKDYPAVNECIKKFRQGVQKLGSMTIIDNFQQFLFLLQPSNSNLLTTKKLNLLLKANFSEEGSNKRLLENAIYGFF